MPTQLLWVVIAYLPIVAADLGLPPGLKWKQGTNHCGDLLGIDAEGTWRVHLEVKSAAAQVNVTKDRCFRTRCKGPDSQFQHMAEDAKAKLLVVTHTDHVKKIEAQIKEKGQHRPVTTRSFADVAGYVEHALTIDRPPDHHLLHALLDVEGTVPADERR